MATRRKAATPTRDNTLIFLAVGVAGFFAAMWFGLPALVPLWVAGLVAAWSSVAVNPDDEKSVRRHRYAKDFQTSLILPVKTLINVNQASWITSVLLGVLGYLLPDTGDKIITAPHGHTINAVLALVISLAISGARSAVLGSDYPGLPLTKIREASKSIPLFFIGIIAGFGLATAAIYELNTHGPKWGYPVNVKLLTPATATSSAVYSQRPSGIFLEYPTAFLIVVAALTGWVFFTMGWGRKALAEWKELSASREAWNAQWLPLKKDPPPRLIERSVIDGILTVETFQILPHETVTEYLAMEPKFAAMTGTKVATLSAPVDNNQPGTWSPVKFIIAQWSDMPDVTNASAELTSWWIRSCMAWTVHTASVYPEPVMSRLALISEGNDEPEDITQKKKSAKGWWARFKENSPTESTLEKQIAKDEAAAAPAPTEPGDQLWVSNWNFPPNCASWYMREEMLGTLIGTAQCEAAIDNRSDTVYFGVLEGESVNPRHATILEALATQDRWRNIWQNALKSGGANAPRAQAALALSANLASGVEVNRMPFTVNEGKNPAEYRDVESTLKTALGGAKFVAITGWPDVDGNVGRPGDRHPQALCVYWSMEAVPSSPSKLEPSVSPANQWVLSGIVNDIFRTLKMAHPEVTAVRPLTKKKSTEHIWEISLRLYGDVTTAQVRKNGPKIAEMLAIPWVRVTDAENGCTLYLGTTPTDEILSRDRDRALVASLDWEQAFLLTSVMSPNGSIPQLISTDHLPSNESVKVLEFSLPPGLSRSMVKAATQKLRTATKNEYIEVLTSDEGPSFITIQASVDNPLAEMMALDFEAADRAKGIAFATGVSGEPEEFVAATDVHLLIAGMTGSGKSVAAQVILYGAAIKGYDIYVIDPTKGAADFRFLEPYAKLIATTVSDAALGLRAIYDEVVRRKDLNSLHGAGSIYDLPEDIRPRPMFVLIDEFTSLIISAEKIDSQPSDDPMLEAERQEQIAMKKDRATIGVMTGKIARESRSAGVSLGLGTQKLMAKTLDSIPGGGDLKDLSLDTLLPVPVSEKFPSGWAHNYQLDVGDLLYTKSGETAPILGFSEVFTDNDMYEITFDDGQAVKAGGEHLWKASDSESRSRWSHLRSHAKDEQPRRDRIEAVIELVTSTPVGTYASSEQLADMVGYGKGTVYRLVKAFGLPAMSVTDVGLTSTSDTMVGVHPRTLYYDASEFFTSLVAYLRDLSNIDIETGNPPPMERVVTTKEMATSLLSRRGERNWSIDVAKPFAGERQNLFVDPYVLGLWLGDGSAGSGIVTSSDAESCTDEFGLTDQAHVIKQLTDAGYQPHVLKCEPKFVGTYGLRVQLRKMGVLHDKHIPAQYLRASFSQRLALLQGLMDSDGTLMNSGQCVFSQTKKRLADEVYELILSLGIRSKRSSWPAGYTPVGETQKKTTGTVYSMSFRTDLPAFRLPRKLAKQVGVIESQPARRRFVHDIKRIPNEPSRCISVDHPEHLFLVAGFIPTHNSNLSRLLIGNTSMGERMSALRAFDQAPDPGDNIPKGRAIWESAVRTGIIVQGWYAPASVLAEELAKRLSPLDESEKIDLSKSKKSMKPLDFSVRATEEGDVIEDVGEFTFSLDEDDEATEEDSTPETEMTSDDFTIDEPTPNDDPIDDNWNVFSTPEGGETEVEQIREPEQVVGSVVGGGDDDFSGWVTPQSHTWEE